MMAIASIPLWVLAGLSFLIGIYGCGAVLTGSRTLSGGHSQRDLLLGTVIFLVLSAGFGAMAAWMVR